MIQTNRTRTKKNQTMYVSMMLFSFGRSLVCYNIKSVNIDQLR